MTTLSDKRLLINAYSGLIYDQKVKVDKKKKKGGSMESNFTGRSPNSVVTIHIELN